MKTSGCFILLFICLSCGTATDHKEEIKADHIPVVGTASIPADTLPVAVKQERVKSSEGYTVRAYKVQSGWGYKIYQEDKLLIDQPHIPAINGLKSFATDKDADKTGKLMVYKLQHNIMPPSISVQELDSLRVRY